MRKAPAPSIINKALVHAPRHTLWMLVCFHVFVIALSNYLVQITVDIAGFHSTWGTFSFPLVYIVTDLTVRIYGSSLARGIIASVMLPALLVSYAVSILFQDAHFQGIEALMLFNTDAARIAFASFAAYLSGQLLDVTLFSRLRRIKYWWVAPTVSSIIGNALDTLIFFWAAFYHSSDAFMAEHWVNIGLLDYGFKILICVMLAIPIYGVVLSVLQRYIVFQTPVKSLKPCS